MQHDTVTVHTVLGVVLKHVKQLLPGVCHVKYLSDGAASQYKNHKNFTIVCCHSSDLGLSAEWHFFATSHGKSICGGIGYIVKCLATRAGLQQTCCDHILTPQQLFEWSKSHISGINKSYVLASDADANRERLTERSSTTVPGTRSHHSFIPLDHNKVTIC